MRNGFRVIDADAHFYEPADIWDRYIEEEYYHRRPRVAKVHGKTLFEYEGDLSLGIFDDVLDAKPLFSQMDSKFGHAFRDGWTLESRLKDMDDEGWDIQVCLPTNGFMAPAHSDPEIATAMCRAYNNWAYDFCGGASERVKFSAIVPGKNVEETVAETTRAVQSLGAVSIVLPPAIPDKMWHHRDYEPLWQLAQDLEFPLSIHGTNSGSPTANARYDGKRGAFISLSEAIRFPFENMIAMAHFMYSGILDRFPRLRLLILESTSGWVPFWLNRLEKYSEGRQSVFFDEKPLGMTPLEYFKAQCAVASDADEPTIKYVVDYIGDDNVVFNTDYPHPDAPGTSEPLRNMMAQPLSDDTKRKILWDNSVKIYGERLVSDLPLGHEPRSVREAASS